MSDAPYQKECSFCEQQIQMSDKSGNWLPYNLNNGPHDCRTKKQEITLQAVQKKMQDIGITINLEKLMNQK